MRLRRGLHKFEAIAPGVFGVETTEARDGGVVGDLTTARKESLAQLVEVAGRESRMSFLGGAKILFNTDVQLL